MVAPSTDESSVLVRPSRRYPTFLNPVTVTATLIVWAVIGAIVWWLS